MNDQELITHGFNHGYQLQKHDPEIAARLQNSFTDKNHPYAIGFEAGSKEYANEQTPEKSDYKKRYFEKIRRYGKGKGGPEKGLDL